MEAQRANAEPGGSGGGAGHQNDVDLLIPERTLVPGHPKVRKGVELAFALAFLTLVVLTVMFEGFPQEDFSFFSGEAITLTGGFSIEGTGEAITISKPLTFENSSARVNLAELRKDR